MAKQYFALIPTDWGVAGVSGSPAGLTGFLWPRASAAKARRAAQRRWPGADERPVERLCAGLARRLADYFAGRTVDLSGVPVDWSALPPFCARVLRALRGVAFGRTISYGELARRAGRPGAARAVGQAMARNPLPVIVPCHRVLRSDGALGGFSGPGGQACKRRLLVLERRSASVTGRCGTGVPPVGTRARRPCHL